MTVSIIESIAAGMHDSDLDAIQKVVEDRLTSLRSMRTVEMFDIGDRVRFNNYCGTKYLHGKTATVVEMSAKKLVVTLDAPVGRFYRTAPDGTTVSAQIKVPPSIVDHV